MSLQNGRQAGLLSYPKIRAGVVRNADATIQLWDRRLRNAA
jgi:hypothetical protein